MSKLPETGPSLLRHLRQQQRAIVRLDDSSPFNFSGVTMTPTGLDIPNSALASPVQQQAIYDVVSGFGLGPGYVAVETMTVTVPEGFTTAAVTMTARVIGYNDNASGGSDGAGSDWIYALPSIAGFNGVPLPVEVLGSGRSGINVVPVANTIDGLTPGAAFDLTVNVATSLLSWAVDPGNTCILNGMISWGN
jgi:hypothetical protein